MSSSITLVETFGLSEDMTMIGEGPAARRERFLLSDRNRTALKEAKQLLDQARRGNRIASMRLSEAVTQSDLFKSALGEVLDRETLAQYGDIETQWPKIAAQTSLKDFKKKRLIELTRNRHALRRVPERTNYPIASTTAEERFISVEKFGEQFGYTLEARVNDDIGELDQVPNGWAVQARYTEDDNVLAQLANPLTGAPNTAFFNVGNGNLGTGLLTPDNLQAAITHVSTKRDKDGRLLRPGRLLLVTGPALTFNAERVLNTTQVEITLADGTKVTQPNPFRGKVTHEEYAGLPGTAWFIIPAPSEPRPAFYSGFLRGFETPDVRYKSDQGKSAGGGDLGADAGSFDDDTTWWRVRHIHGAAQGDPVFTWASDGIEE